MPPNITPPLVLRYGATDVPIIQLSLSSNSLPDTKLNDLGQNIIRPDLAVVHGAEVPYPYGGKPRVIMVDLDQQALESRGMSPSDVSEALRHQNVILPAGDVKIGSKDYTLTMNSSPDIIKEIDAFPIKQVGGKTVFMRDVAHVHDGFQVQTNSVSVNGKPGALMTIRKTGGVSTLAVIDGVRKALPDIEKVLPKRRFHQGDLRPIAFRQSRAQQCLYGRGDGCRPDGHDDHAVSRQLAADSHYTCLHSAVDNYSRPGDVYRRADAQYHDAGRFCACGRNSGR